MFLINNTVSLAKTLVLSLTAVVFLSYTSIVFAIDPSSKLPIEIESDRATLDDETGISNYAGNVIITQGKSKLEADNISVNAINRKIVSIKATGSPAHFTQQTQGESRPTHGYADTIIYTALDSTLKLIKNASLIQDNNSFSGEQIEYDISRRAIRAKGDKAEGTRVKIEYYPQDNTSNDNSAANDTNSSKETTETKTTNTTNIEIINENP